MSKPLCCRASEKRKAWLDRLEFLQSVILAMQLTSSVKISVSYMVQYDMADFGKADDPFPTIGLVLVALVIAWEVLLVLKYALAMWKLRFEGSFKLVGLTPQRLKLRLGYMTKPIRPKQPVPLAVCDLARRLILLTLAALAPEVVEGIQRVGSGAQPQNVRRDHGRGRA